MKTLVYTGALCPDGSWFVLDPWELDDERGVNVIRRMLTRAIAERGGAVAIAEVHVSGALLDANPRAAQEEVDRAIRQSFAELIAGGPSWTTEDA